MQSLWFSNLSSGEGVSHYAFYSRPAHENKLHLSVFSQGDPILDRFQLYCSRILHPGAGCLLKMVFKNTPDVHILTTGVKP